MKKWLAIILGLVILAFIFADSLFYLAGRWQEKTGRIKEAVRTWMTEAKEAVE